MGIVAVAGGVTGGVGDADEVAASVVIVGGNPACGIVDGNRQVEGFVVVDLGAAAVRRGDGDDVAFGIVKIAGFASERVAFYGNAAVAVTFAVAALSIGVDAVDEFAVFVETVHFRPPQCVGGGGFGRGRLKVGFQTTFMLTVNEIVKEQMFQTTSKKIVRCLKNRNRVRAYRTHPTSGLEVSCGLKLAK